VHANCVSRPGGLSKGCFLWAGEVHRALLEGKQKGGVGKQDCHMGYVILNMCTDSSSYLLESRTVVLLVSWGKQGPLV